VGDAYARKVGETYHRAETGDTRPIENDEPIPGEPNGVENGVASKGGDPEAVVVQAQQDLLREEEIRAYARLASQAKALDEAWENLQRGTYGICRQCRGQIPQRRLEALPGAALCLSCQEEEEQALGGVQTRGGSRAGLMEEDGNGTV